MPGIFFNTDGFHWLSFPVRYRLLEIVVLRWRRCIGWLRFYGLYGSFVFLSSPLRAPLMCSIGCLPLDGSLPANERAPFPVRPLGQRPTSPDRSVRTVSAIAKTESSAHYGNTARPRAQRPQTGAWTRLRDHWADSRRFRDHVAGTVRSTVALHGELNTRSVLEGN